MKQIVLLATSMVPFFVFALLSFDIFSLVYVWGGATNYIVMCALVVGTMYVVGFKVGTITKNGSYLIAGILAGLVLVGIYCCVKYYNFGTKDLRCLTVVIAFSYSWLAFSFISGLVALHKSISTKWKTVFKRNK
jgi:hypothetical protein